MANLQPQPYYAIRTRRPAEGSSTSSVDSTVCLFALSLPLFLSWDSFSSPVVVFVV